MIKEKENLNKKIESLKNPQENEKKSEDFNDSGSIKDIETDDTVLNEINNYYKDPLTGLWKYEYFIDQVIPKIYDSRKNYKLDNDRVIFFSEVNGLEKINETSGHSEGDRILINIAQIIISSITKSGMNTNNIAIKKDGCYIFGYLNDVNLLTAVDIFADISAEVFNIHTDIKIAEYETIHPSLNTALYQERTGTNADHNITVAKKILSFVNEKSRNNIAFPKITNLTISERYYTRSGLLDDSVLTLYRK